MTPFSYHSSNLSLIALEAMRLLVLISCANEISFWQIWKLYSKSQDLMMYLHVVKARETFIFIWKYYFSHFEVILYLVVVSYWLRQAHSYLHSL